MDTPAAFVKEIPSAFISYSWDSETHKDWVVRLGARLRGDGVDLILDEWSAQLGDQLPHFMERAISDSDRVLIVCTPRYKQRSDARAGGVGYEGNVITGQLLTAGNERKFLPILRAGEWTEAAPAWLAGKRYTDLRGEPYSEDAYRLLVQTIHNTLPVAPPVGPQPASLTSTDLNALSVTEQRTYAELVNLAVRTHQAANKRMVILKNGSAVAQQMLPAVEAELSAAGDKFFEVQREINLLSSEPVAKAAGELAGWVLLVQMNSMAPQREAEFNDAFQKMVKEGIPKFREAVRRELAQRGGAA